MSSVTSPARAADGVSREVFALLGSKTDVPLVPTDMALKNKRSSGRATPWVWRGFTSSARPDGLTLYHWVQATDRSADYKFARFNKSVPVPTYTAEEYEEHLKGWAAARTRCGAPRVRAQPCASLRVSSDGEWSKQATDKLMELARQFDLRFIVMHDRWVGHKCTVEDLKARYYDVAGKMANVRLSEQRAGKAPPSGERPVAVDDPLLTFKFDKAHEVERKATYEALYHRDRRQVDEELKLLEQAREIERRLRESRKAQVKQLRQAEEGGAAGLEGAGAAASGSAARGQKPRAPGPYLRSTELTSRRLAADKGSERLEAKLRELDVPLRPAPSKETVPVYNNLRSSVVQLIELEMKLRKLEGEAKVFETRYEHAEGGGVPRCPRSGLTDLCGSSPVLRKATFLKQGSAGGGKAGQAGGGGAKRQRAGGAPGEGAADEGKSTDKRGRKGA